MKFKENSTFSRSDPVGLKLLTRLRLNLSHLNEHKFRHNYTVNSKGSYGVGAETTDHYLLRCLFALVRSSFLNRIFEINFEFRNVIDLTVTSFLLFGSE